jgi:8-oxo-dGTP pyrophosphatase MutT (NUDIX family)
MHSADMSGGDPQLIPGWSRPRTLRTASDFIRLSRLRKLRACKQVAAVCYRVRKDEIQFLLVQTRNGRWTFPKGSAEPGLTHAQAAALEAFEEAGVHGRMEEAAFAEYIRHKGGNVRSSALTELSFSAHLCEVRRLDPPQESNRNRTWFSVADTKQNLREDRDRDYGAKLARVVDRAVSRIQRLRSEINTVIDAPREVVHGVINIDNGRQARINSKLSGKVLGTG